MVINARFQITVADPAFPEILYGFFQQLLPDTIPNNDLTALFLAY